MAGDPRESLASRPTLDTRSDASLDGGGLTALPERIGPYEVRGEIARGGMGVVVRALQPDLRRDVAVKLMRDGYLATEGDRQRFRVEAAAAASLAHPGIVTVHEAGEHEGLAWFSMELVEGRSLRERLRDEGPLEPVAAARLVAEIADAVEHAHGQGLLHRDLKPANILLTPGGRPKVTDFGIAVDLDAERSGDQDSRSGLSGTPSYMAPEQAGQSEDALGPATDVYGLGALLYECVTGRPPFVGDSIGQVLVSVLTEEPPSPRRHAPKLPGGLEAVIMQCLRKRPDGRYQSAGELAEDLRRFAAGLPVEVESQGPFARLLRWMHWRPALAATWTALALFYANEWLLWWFQDDVTTEFHLRVSVLVGAWALGAWGLQGALERTKKQRHVRYFWSGFDVGMLTGLLLIADGPSSPLVMAYPLLVLTSGFRWRMGLVSFVGLLCLLAYGGLVLDAGLRRPALLPALDEALILCVAVIVTALMTGTLVLRLRGLAGLNRR